MIISDDLIQQYLYQQKLIFTEFFKGAPKEISCGKRLYNRHAKIAADKCKMPTQEADTFIFMGVPCLISYGLPENHFRILGDKCLLEGCIEEVKQ